MSGPEAVLAMPDNGPPAAAVLVLAGSSGRIETDRVRLLAAHGAAAMSMRWFGGPGQPPGICEVPLETFSAALDQLSATSSHLAIVGISKGAEAALLLAAAADDRVRAVAAFSPTSVVWANVGPGRDGSTTPARSSWTRNGDPVPFVPYDPAWSPPEDGRPPAFRRLYEQSLTTYAEQAETAAIPVENMHADLLVTGGGDDQIWPSDAFAATIAERRARNGRTTRLLIDPAAGHGVTLPGEPPTPPAKGLSPTRRGGTAWTDAEMGSRCWPHLADMLRLDNADG